MEETNYFNNDLPIYIEDECINRHKFHNGQAHRHDNDIEIICVNKGSLKCNAGNDVFSLQKGDICFINQQQLHHLNDELDDSEHTVLIINTSLITQNPNIYEKCIKPILEDKNFGHVRFDGSDSNASVIEKKMLEIKDALNKKDDGYELQIISLIHEILLYIYRAYNNRNKKYKFKNVNIETTQEMIEYIRDNYDHEISLDDICEIGNVSRSQCSKLFKQYTDQSPINYLNLYRLEKSRELLRNSNLSISEIALSCGFNEQSYYNRLFLREYACTPLEYRKGEIR